ncbi:MAG: flagellar motor protein MotB [Alphaproteobacteria bacterium]|jgi:chemotaxis protein MotB|nr:flagellar motor protein MotB [Alphaproteobacteria bacterium]MDP6563728.1 flagellar motor protein MotB [Alphaproteobacteria bacterium]MDP6815749.1 flagellar motor protein MotB [Alphaproteobacteria bacterium]
MIEQFASLPRRQPDKGWMITFADLMALLLTFFVLLFSMSKVETEAWQALVDALANRLNPSHESSRPLLESERNAPQLFASRAIDLDYLAGVMQDKIADDPTLRRGLLRRLDDRLVFSLPGELVFEPGQASLHAASEPAMVALGAALQLVGNSVSLIGHSDPSPPPPNSPFTSNWDLSLARAVVLANALTASGYPHPLRVLGAADAGYADLSPGLSEGQRQRLSRRVDIVIRETGIEGGGDGQ